VETFSYPHPQRGKPWHTAIAAVAKFPRKTEKEGYADPIDAWAHAGWSLEPSLFQFLMSYFSSELSDFLNIFLNKTKT
jgi:hypothetical protein